MCRNMSIGIVLTSRIAMREYGAWANPLSQRRRQGTEHSESVRASGNLKAVVPAEHLTQYFKQSLSSQAV